MKKLEGIREFVCTLVSDRDPLTQTLRTGAELRYRNPPQFVSYDLQLERLGYPKYLGHYRFAPLTLPLSAAKLFTEALFPVGKKNSTLIHSFFWSIHRYSVPWIHENDQSLGQYLPAYLEFDGSLMRTIVAFTSNVLNSAGCRGIVVWSEWARNGFVKDGVEMSKIHVIPPPISVRPSYNYRPCRGKEDPINILFIGRDYERKGGEIAFKVFDNLKNTFDNLRLIYVGEIRDTAVLRNIRQERNKIIHYDHVTSQFLHQNIFPAADIFLLPTNADAYGMSIVEAMSKGIPVVSSDISAIPEIVEDGTCGFLCKPRDLENFTRACALLLEDGERRRVMGEKALAYVSRKLLPQTVGRKLYNLYCEALS
jgi:glycosyltransferase involved in cell wall biosynthesis